MSLNWKMDRDDKPVYTEGGHGNFFRPRDVDLPVQPTAGAGELLNLGIGPEKKKRAVSSISAPMKGGTDKAHVSKTKNVGEKKVSVREPKPEPRDSSDIPPSNPSDPIDLDSSPEHLVHGKAGKRKQADTDTEGQPPTKIQRKKITRKGNLDSFIPESVEVHVSHAPTELQSVVNEEPPVTPLRASGVDQLEPIGIADGGAENIVEARDPVDIAKEAEKVVDPGVTDDAGKPHTPETVAEVPGNETSAEKISIPSPTPSDAMPEHVEKVTVEGQSSSANVGKHSPIRPEETLGDYYYRTYAEKDASDPHTPVWNLKKGDTFSTWRVCQD
ncbi:hypothetical protein Hdeb2414_s0006g00220111 [Helianthus debilis subsp. tardiflorus]